MVHTPLQFGCHILGRGIQDQRPGILLQSSGFSLGLGIRGFRLRVQGRVFDVRAFSPPCCWTFLHAQLQGPVVNPEPLKLEACYPEALEPTGPEP